LRPLPDKPAAASGDEKLAQMLTYSCLSLGKRAAADMNSD
jgi:hypothetical protein